jgi:hypothetical protein
MTSNTDLKKQISEMQVALAAMMVTLQQQEAVQPPLPLPSSPPPSERALTPFAAFVAANSVDIKRLRGSKKASGALQLLCIGGRLWSAGVRGKASDAQINEVIAFLEANPDYKSAQALKMAAKTSTAPTEAVKKRGRPRKMSTSTEAAVSVPEERDEAWVEEDIEVAPFEHEAKRYYKSQYGDLFDSDSFAYLGRYVGDRVHWTTEVPPRVARYLAA